MLCAGQKDDSAGSCEGDEGGALAYNNIAYGIHAYSALCGLAAHPGVYTRITHYVDWVDRTISM